jgi:hypothetical protein
MQCHGNSQAKSFNCAMTDNELIELWLHGKADRTIEGYRTDIGQFLERIRRPLV